MNKVCMTIEFPKSSLKSIDSCYIYLVTEYFEFVSGIDILSG